MTTRRTVEIMHVGDYAAEVAVDLIEEEGGWSPYFSFDDAQKLEAVRIALQAGDVEKASQLARVYKLLPISA